MEWQTMFLGIVFCLLVIGQCSESRRVKRQYVGGFQQPYFSYKARPLRLKEKEEQQDFSKIPGVPGVDYPIYHSVPLTSFDCGRVPVVPGMYANIETGCQAYHVCNDGRDGPQGSSFLCTNGTLFNQKEFTCDWWYNVDCNDSLYYYSFNLDPLKNPYTKKAKEEELENQQVYNQYHRQ